MLTEKSFDTGEIVINYSESETVADPLVLLHGSTLRWQTFWEFIPTLERSWHVYACDLRGHGKSGRAHSGYRVVDFVPDSSAFIQRSISQPTVLVGFSTGAVVTLGVAARLPKLIRGIVLLEPPLLVRDSSIKEATGPYPWFTWVMETLTTTYTFEEVIERCKEREPEADELSIRDTADMISGIDPASIAILLNDQFYEGFDWRRILTQVNCPALLVRGEPEMGGLVRDRDVVFLEAHLPQLVTKQVKAAHGIIWGPPGEETLEHVTQFLNSL